MMIHVTIIENDSNELEQLRHVLDAWSSNNSTTLSVTTHTSGEDYFYANTTHISNVFFLDIQLDGMNGLDIAKQLRQDGYTGEIIFLTSFREYVFGGYKVHALNYLLKPLEIESLYSCMNEIKESLQTNYYIFRNNQEIVQIWYRDILSFSSFMHNIDILTSNEHFSQRASLGNILSHLPKQFIRVHRSHIVNMAHIYKISGNTITLSNRTTVPIGRQYLNDVRNTFTAYATRMDQRVL